MGKKRNHPSLEEVLQRPWCYYCERDFDDLKILINHQKAKHYKCDRCNRRLNTAGGLSVHMTQVHKESLDAIENALPNRAGLEVEIFGMEGIPEDVRQAHNQRVIAQFSQAEADRRASSGNSAPGSAGSANPAKKAKFESPSDLKKRLAEHKAKMAEEAAAKAAQANQIDQIRGQSPGYGQPPGITGPMPTFGQPLGAPPAPGLNGFPQPYGQPAPSSFQAPPAYGTPAGAQFPQPPQFSPPVQQFQSPNNAYAPPSQYQTGPNHGQIPSNPPRAFGTTSPSVPFQASSPPQGTSLPQRSNNLPTPPGLPQRPSFGAPPISNFQMQQLHQGQVPESISSPYNGQPLPATTDSQRVSVTGAYPVPGTVPPPSSTPVPPPAPSEVKLETKGTDGSTDKKAKKDKDKDVKLVYSDNDISPEEKMATLSRYAFEPREREETVLGNVTAAVTGVASGPEDPARDGNRGPGRDD